MPRFNFLFIPFHSLLSGAASGESDDMIRRRLYDRCAVEDSSVDVLSCVDEDDGCSEPLPLRRRFRPETLGIAWASVGVVVLSLV